MQRAVTAAIVMVVALSASLLPQPARAIGVYEDAAGYAGFLVSPHRPGIRAALIRTDGGDREASVFLASGTYPVRDNVLFQIEQSFIAVTAGPDIESGFGDTYLRARLRVAGGEHRVVHLLGGLRVGSGSRIYYPYASKSYDMGLDVGYVDSLDVASLWASAGGVVVKREPEGLPESDRHQNFARFTAGIEVPVGSALAVSGGAAVLLFRSGSVRDIYLAQVRYRRTPALELRVSGHAEAGATEERVSDLALTVAIHSFF